MALYFPDLREILATSTPDAPRVPRVSLLARIHRGVVGNLRTLRNILCSPAPLSLQASAVLLIADVVLLVALVHLTRAVF